MIIIKQFITENSEILFIVLSLSLSLSCSYIPFSILWFFLLVFALVFASIQSQSNFFINHPHSGEHSSASQDQRLWKRLWSLNVPSKVKTFMWRACYNVLPTKSNLARQKVQIDPKCSFCGQQDETTQHILWEYPFARNVWALVRGKLQKSSFVTEEFFMLARHMVHRLGGKDLELWAITSWSLWNTQNRF